VKGTPLTHVKICLNFWGLPRKRVWYVRELPWKHVGNFGSRNYFKSDLLRPWIRMDQYTYVYVYYGCISTLIYHGCYTYVIRMDQYAYVVRMLYVHVYITDITRVLYVWIKCRYVIRILYVHLCITDIRRMLYVWINMRMLYVCCGSHVYIYVYYMYCVCIYHEYVYV